MKTLDELIREALEIVGQGAGVEVWADRTGGFKARLGGLAGAGGSLETALTNAIEHFKRAHPNGRLAGPHGTFVAGGGR